MKNLRHLLRRVKPTKSRRTSEVRSRGPLSKNRRLLSETLEKRQLFAMDLGAALEPAIDDVDNYAVAHNYWNQYDVNNDGFITALDALRVINFMNENPEGEATGESVNYAGFVDVNADHFVSSIDALQVINELNLAEGEDVPGVFDVAFELTPRKLDDSLLSTAGTYTTTSGETGVRYTVDQDEIFKLEVAVQDNRGRNAFGVFQAVTDIIIDQSGVIVPAVGEIQGFNFDSSILDNASANGTIRFFFDNDPSDFVEVSVGTFLGADDPDVVQFITNAIVNLSDDAGELNITADEIDVTAGTTSASSPYLVRIEYNGSDLANVNIPRLETRLTINGSLQNVVTVEENVNLPDGSFNANTLVGRYETFMRNHPNTTPAVNDGLGPLIYGQNRNIGSFDLNVGGRDIFDEVGTLGPVGNLRTLIPGFSSAVTYDAFSIPVRAIKAATNVGVKLDTVEAREGFEGVLVYGTDNGKEGVAPGLIRTGVKAEFQLTVNGAASGITASNATLSLEEDKTTATTVQLNVTAATQGETITYAVPARQGALGTATISSTGVFSYIPDLNKFGTDVVTYTASTPTDGTATATVTVTVTNVNDIPVANDDPASGILSVNVGSNLLISVLANDDAGGGNEPLSELTITAGPTPAKGTIAVVGNQIRYTPTAGTTSGPDTFTYTITDTGGLSDTATVTVSVVNNQMGVSAGDKSITINEDNSSVAGATTSEVLIADLGGADAGLIVVNTGTGFTLDNATVTSGLGSARISGNQIFYTPAQNDDSAAVVTYTASNTAGGDTGVISIAITPVNDRPVAPALDFSVNEGSTRTLNVLQPGAGNTAPSDVETPTSGLIVSLPPQSLPTALADISVVNNQIVVVSKGTFAQGGFSFQYRVQDAEGLFSENGVININIVDVLGPPVAADRTEPAVNEDAPNIVVNLLALTTLEGSDTATFTIESQASNLGVATISGNNLILDLTDNANGTGQVVYRATGSNGFDLGTISFTVNAVNDAPALAAIGNQTVQENGFVDINVRAAATDVDDTALTVVIVQQGTKGNATVNGGVVRYTHNTAQLGADSIQVRVTDPSNATSETRTININITDVVLAPVASPGTLNAAEDGPNVTLDLKTLVNAQAGNVTFTITQPASGRGTASVSNGVLTYDPNADFNGQTSLTYTATNSLGSSTNTITINVSATNDAPIAVSDSFDVIKNTARTLNVLANDTPNPGGETDTFTVTVAAGNGPAKGTVSIANNVITYTPNLNAIGSDSFTYTLTDSAGASSTAVVTISIKDFAPSVITGQLFVDSISNISEVISVGATPIRSGAFESGETTLTGVRVRLNGVGGASAQSFTAVTDRDGRYTFENVPPGNYEIRYDLPPGMKISGPGANGVIPVNIPAAGGLTGPSAVQGNFTIESLGSQGYAGRNILSTDPRRAELPASITAGETSSFFYTKDANNVLMPNTVLVGQDFGSAKYVELLINQDRDQALLVVVDDLNNVEAANIPSANFVVTDGDGVAQVQLFGGMNDFVFSDVDDVTDITGLYPEYESAINDLLNSL